LVNVTKRFGSITAIENISLQIKDGEYVCIIGPSGCGKTTLIKCISGIFEPTDGEIYIGNQLINHVPLHERGIGYVFQEIALFPHMSIYDNVSYGPRVKGWEITKTRSLIEEMLNLMALKDRAPNYPDELSGGAQQKTAIARALASGSILLLLDEPLGSLDTKVRMILRRELRKIVKDLKLTAIHVTHDQEEAMVVSDRIVVMKAGGIIEVGTPLELYLYPKKIFTANFVGEANFMIGEIMNITSRKVKIRVNNGILYSTSKVNIKKDKVVVAIRPEFVNIDTSESRKDLWKGEIENKAFLGNVIRYEVRTDNGELIAVKQPFSPDKTRLDVGRHVNLIFPSQYVLLYPYPDKGLEKEISIE